MYSSIYKRKQISFKRFIFFKYIMIASFVIILIIVVNTSSYLNSGALILAEKMLSIYVHAHQGN